MAQGGVAYRRTRTELRCDVSDSLPGIQHGAGVGGRGPDVRPVKVHLPADRPRLPSGIPHRIPNG